MAILRAIPRRRRRPTYTGRIMIDAVRGVLRVRKWPKKRGTPPSAKQRFWIDWFAQANLLAKYADPMSQLRAKLMTKGTGLYPRDVLLKAMRGRLYWWVDQDGRRWYPMAAIGDISNTLDVLAQTVGSVLVRAVDRWRAPPPGAVGDVLTYRGPTAPPEWSPVVHPSPYLGGALVAIIAAQSIPSGVWTTLNWTTETYDTASIHDLVVNPSRLTVPPGFSRVRLDFQVQWAAHATGNRVLTIDKNGTFYPGQPKVRVGATPSSSNIHGITSPVLEVAPGDYFDARAFQNAGVALNILSSASTWFTMTLIS